MDVMIHRREEGVIHKSAPGAWALTFTMFALAVVVVIARVSTRIYYKHFGVDDAFIILALASTTIFVTVLYSLIQQLRPPDFAYFEVHHFCMDIVYSVTYAFGMALTKVSALLFLRRIGYNAFGRVSDWIIWGDIVWTLVGATQLCLFQIFACRPLSALSTCWKDARPGSCIDYKPSVFAYSLNLLVGNIPIIIMPTLLIIRLNMQPRKKILMYSVPLLAVIDTAITFFRMLRYAERIWPDMKTNFRSEYFYGFDVALTPVEVFLALLTASLPMIYCPSKNLFRYLKAVYVSRSFRPGSVLGGSGHTASRYPSAPRDDISSKGHVQRAGAGLLSAPRRVKAGLYQLGTINQDDPSSSTERVIAASNSAETKRPRSAASDDESGSWRQDRLT